MPLHSSHPLNINYINLKINNIKKIINNAIKIKKKLSDKVKSPENRWIDTITANNSIIKIKTFSIIIIST